MTKEKLNSLKKDSQNARTTLNNFKKLLRNNEELIKYVPENCDYYSYIKGMYAVVDELNYQLNKK